MSKAFSLLSAICSAVAIAEFCVDVASTALGGGAGIGIAMELIVLIIRGSDLAVVMGRDGEAVDCAKNAGVFNSP